MLRNRVVNFRKFNILENFRKFSKLSATAWEPQSTTADLNGNMQATDRPYMSAKEVYKPQTAYHAQKTEKHSTHL